MSLNTSGNIAMHIEACQRTFSQIDTIHEVARLITNTLKAGGKILLCGNGGSAADASHLAAEFVGRMGREGRPLPAMALTDMATLTALANDRGYARSYSDQVAAWGRTHDVLIAISTSGESENVVQAMYQADKLNMWIVGMAPQQSTIGRNAHYLLDCQGETQRKQEVQILQGHLIAEAVHEMFGGSG